MLRFRPATDALGPVDDLLAVGQLIDDAMRPGHFFVAPDLHLTWVAAKSETIRWEIFRGRLVEAAQTRQEKTFLSWHILEADATEPTISVKLDVHERCIHVTRGLLCYVWEGHEVGGVIESREVVKWTRELVGTIMLADFTDREPLRDELICLIWQAIVGTSRLPLTSVEAPLPAFSFGQLHYVYRDDAGTSPMMSWQDLASCWSQPDLARAERAKLLEFVLRRGTWAALFFSTAIGSQSMSLPLWRAMFNSVSLSPFTQFVDNALFMINIGAPQHEDAIDFHGDLLCKLCRHLTAFDLVTFHHRGANYPDGLLLDTAIKRYMNHASFSELFLGAGLKARMRRRALRQGCMLRRHYEGLLVPDMPTSPGENARVAPASHPRVPDEQLTQANRRRRQLFTDEPLRELVANLGENAIRLATSFEIRSRFRAAFEQSIRDLEHLDERVEMGLGLFIDRPLGYAKAIGEPDLTPMLAHEAFSPSIARQRWQELKKLCAELAIPCDAERLDLLFEHGPWPTGLPHAEVRECPRPTAALCDVRKVADDFVILRTMPVGLRDMLDQFDLRERLPFPDVRLCTPEFDKAGQPVLVLYDTKLRQRVEIEVDASQGYACRAGVELPKPGLRVRG
ncbi:MAG: hypothetical protein HY289_13030 [Planctomycetes bacterium]|nr:hypothetical protein [Planctomycetota bacterium]